MAQNTCVELPVGAAVTAGALEILAVGLTQPFTVRVTVKLAAFVTVIELVVIPLLHRMFPAPVAVKTEEPQFCTAITVGAEGVARGAVVALAGALVQPFIV